MLQLPRSTEFNKRIPKQKFYENLSVTPALKRVFIDQIRNIYWRNKLSPETVNIAKGDAVTELEVFEIQLSQPSLDEAVLRLIDKEIPYHILFLLTHEDKLQAWIGYKEAASGAAAFKVDRYYHTDWLDPDKLILTLSGLNMDAVYEGFVRQIAGEALQPKEDESLKESVDRDARRQQLEKQIAALQAKVRKEKQLNKQIMMNAELKRIKKDLETL